MGLGEGRRTIMEANVGIFAAQVRKKLDCMKRRGK
jgi:hypothetical protein